MRLLVALMLILVALSGCSDDGPSEASKMKPTTSTPTTSPGTSSQTQTQTAPAPDPVPEPEPENTPPSALLSVSPASGAAPLNVTFSINGTDADGDALSWSLDLDGDGTADINGTTLPSTYNATYELGNHSAILTIHDGQATATASVNLTATAPAGPTGPIQVVEATYTVPVEGCTIAFPSVQAATDIAGAAGNELDGVTRVQFDVVPQTYGRPFTVSWSHDVGYLYAALAFTDAEGAILNAVGTDPAAQEAGAGDVTKEGIVPADAVFGVAWTCGGPTAASVHYQA